MPLLAVCEEGPAFSWRFWSWNRTENPRVGGSIPPLGTKYFKCLVVTLWERNRLGVTLRVTPNKDHGPLLTYSQHFSVTTLPG